MREGARPVFSPENGRKLVMAVGVALLRVPLGYSGSDVRNTRNTRDRIQKKSSFSGGGWGHWGTGRELSLCGFHVSSSLTPKQDPHHHHHRFTATAPSPGPRTAKHRASSWAQLPRKLAKTGQERQERRQEKWGVKGPVPERHLPSPQGLDGMTTVPTKQPRACPLPSLSGNFPSPPSPTLSH